MIKGVHLTNFKKNCLIASRFFSYEERYTYYESKKAKNSIFDMSSCIKPEIQNDLHKITKIK